MIQGKVTAKLINPTTLRNTFRNVSLNLPDEYELKLGTQMDNVYSYYDLISITLVGDIHCMKITLNILLKTVNRQFVLYKVIVLATPISGDKFVMYSIEHSYLGIDNKRQDLSFCTQADLSRCTVYHITICPANTAVYTAQKMTRLSSIYFQENHNICSRKLLLHYKTPTLLRHGNTWAFHFPEPRQVSL